MRKSVETDSIPALMTGRLASYPEMFEGPKCEPHAWMRQDPISRSTKIGSRRADSRRQAGRVDPARVRYARELVVVRIQRDLRQPGKSESSRGCRRQVDNATAHERAAIIDRYDHGTPVVLIGDLDLGAER